jgi:hypothetical protein
MAHDPHGRRLLLFGGAATPPALTRQQPLLFDDTWEYLGAGVGWRRVDGGSGPGPRSLPALAGAERGLLLFGGLSPTGDLLGDTWLFSGGRWERRAAGGCAPDSRTSFAAPPCRAGAALAPSPQGVLLVGGLTGRDATGAPSFDDTVWRWDGSAWTPADVACPPAVLHRWQHRLVPLGAGRLLLSFGETDGVVLKDAFVLSAHGLFVPQTGIGPSGRAGAAVAFDEERGEVVLLGGRGTAGGLADTWLFSEDQGWRDFGAR